MRSSIKTKVIPAVIVTLVLTAYQLVRVLTFVNVYGGLEHDSGWFLGVSRSLAERGTYTTLVSTLSDPTVAGGIGVDGKFDVQGANGSIWFFTGSGTGPTSILVDALVIKLFGSQFWALRAGPLLFYALFLLLAAYTLFQLAGIWGIVLFHAFLFFYPHLSIPLSYEAEGEVPTMVFILWAFLAFTAASSRKDSRVRRFALAGLVAGLAITTKMLAILSIGAVLIWMVLCWLSERRRPPVDRELIRPGEIVSYVGGVVLIPLLWEAIQFFVLTRFAGYQTYLLHLRQRTGFVLDDGSGLGQRTHAGVDFVADKFFLLEQVTHPQRWVTSVVFVILLVGGGLLVYLWRVHSQRQYLVAVIWLGWLANTAWFICLAKTGWARHLWFALVLAVMLLSVLIVNLIQSGWSRAVAGGDAHPVSRTLWLDWGQTAGGVIVLALVVWGFLSQRHVWGVLLPDTIVPYWQQRQLENEYDASLPWIIIPRAQQEAVVDYINRLPAEAKVYYPDRNKGAEIPTLTNRINYPLQRRSHPATKAHCADVVLVPSSMISPWRDAGIRKSLLDMVDMACPNPVLQSDYYVLCLADEVTIP